MTALAAAALACSGWLVALGVAISLRRRLRLMADAEHELRGAAAALGLAAERMAQTGATAALVSVVRLQLGRIAAGLADLAAARGSPPPATPGEELDGARLAQALGNLVANAAEHGVGPVDVRTSRLPGAVRIEIRNRNRPREVELRAGAIAGAGRPAGGRGRGLAIADRAARELGGRLSVKSEDGETRAALELPADRAA